MKFVKIKIENFKKLMNYEVDFAQKNEFFGFNGVGKTTVLDAIVWCLFGVNYRDEARFDINPIVNGIQRYDLYPSVTLTVLDDDGRDYEIQRSLVKGNTGERSTITQIDISGSKFGTKKFEEYINTKFGITKDEFKLLSNINYASSLNQKELRNIIMNLVGDVSDKELLENDTEGKYNLIADKILLVGTEKFKQDLSKSKTKYKEDSLVLSGKIQNEESTIDSIKIDQEQVRISKARKEELMNVLDNYKKRYDAENQKQIDINEISNQIIEHKTLYNSMLASLNQVNNDGQIIKKKIELAMNEEMLRQRDVNKLELQYQKLQQMYQMLVDESIRLETTLDKQRDDLTLLKEQEVIVDETTCKYCGQSLPKEKIESVKKKMEAEKAETIKAREEEINLNEEKLEDTNNKIDNYTENMKLTKAEIEKVKVKDYSAEVTDNPEIETLKNQRMELLERFSKLKKEMDDKRQLIANLENKKSYMPRPNQIPSVENVKIELDTINQKLSLYETLQYHIGNLQKLSDEKTTLDKKMVTLQAMEIKLTEFMSYKSKVLNDRLRENFHLISFKTSDMTISGKEVECFEITMNDKSFSALSGGERMLASLDLINGIQKLKKKHVPILIDSVGELSEMPSFLDSQIISCRAMQKPSKTVKRKDADGNIVEAKNENYEKMMLIYGKLNVRRD